MQMCSSTGSCLDTESRSWELQAAASQLPWQQQLRVAAVTKNSAQRTVEVAAQPSLILQRLSPLMKHLIQRYLLWRSNFQN